MAARLQEAVLEGEYKEPPYEPLSKRPPEEQLKADLAKIKNAAPAPGVAPPLEANPLTADDAQNRGAEEVVYNTTGYSGLSKFFQYDNFAPTPVKDGVSCGQAAVATVLTKYKKLNPTPNGQSVTDVWNRYAPDTPWQAFGTTPSRVQSALQGFGLRTWLGAGRSNLQTYVSYGYPAIVLLDLGAMGGKWWTGHYVVVMGYTSYGPLVTNYQANKKDISGYTYTGSQFIDWATFERGWNGTVAAGVGMGGKFILGY